MSCAWMDDLTQHTLITITAAISLHVIIVHHTVADHVTPHCHKQLSIATKPKGRALTDATSFQLIDISAHVSGTSKFDGAATAQDGKVVFAPWDAAGVGVFDPTDNSFQLVDISWHVRSLKFSGAVTAQDGKVVFAPWDAAGVGVFDPTDNSFQLVDISAHVSGNYKFDGAATAQDGKVIFAPCLAAGVGVFDPTDNSFQVVDISAQVSGRLKFSGAAVAQDGKVVFAPEAAAGVGVFDPRDTTTTTRTTVTITSSTSTMTTTRTTVTTTSSTSSTTSSTTATRTDSMTQELYAIQASEQGALVKVLAFTSGTDPGSVIIEKPNTTMVTHARRIDVQAAAESGGFASVTVSSRVTDGLGGGEASRVGAAVPQAMIQQLAASGGTEVVLIVTASKQPATEENFTPGAAAGSAAGAPAEDAAPPTEPTLQITLATPLVSVRVAVNGKMVSVRDLTEPILVTVLPKKKAGFECGFYNETSLEWSSEGMWEHDTGNGALVCASTHLTVFAAIKKTWVGLTLAVTCIPAEFLTARGLSSITRSSWQRLFGVICLCLFTLSQAWACFLYQAYCGHRRYHPRPLGPGHDTVSFSYYFMSGRHATQGGWLVQLQRMCPEWFADVPSMVLAPVKALRVRLAKESVLQRASKDLDPMAKELQIMLQWRQAERSRRQAEAERSR